MSCRNELDLHPGHHRDGAFIPHGLQLKEGAEGVLFGEQRQRGRVLQYPCLFA